MAARRAWLLVAAHACLREAHGTTAYEERSLATRTQETAAGRGEGTDERITIDDTTEKKYIKRDLLKTASKRAEFSTTSVNT